MSAINIRSERLLLDPLTLGDAPRLYEYRSDPEVSRYQSFVPKTLEDARHFATATKGVELGTPGRWRQLAIRMGDPLQQVGDLGVHFLEEDPRQLKFGVTVAPSHQRRGIAREAVITLLDYLIRALPVHRIFASVDPRNVSSVALLAGVGMRQEAHFRESLWLQGEWVDDIVFAILQSEWKSLRGSP